MTNNVYISTEKGFSPSSDFPALAIDAAQGLADLGYVARPGANDVLTVYGGSLPYLYAALLKYSAHEVVIFFTDLAAVQMFLVTYMPLLPVLEYALNL